VGQVTEQESGDHAADGRSRVVELNFQIFAEATVAQRW